MEEVQKRFLAEQKTLKELNEKARQIETCPNVPQEYGFKTSLQTPDKPQNLEYISWLYIF